MVVSSFGGWERTGTERQEQQEAAVEARQAGREGNEHISSRRANDRVYIAFIARVSVLCVKTGDAGDGRLD